MTKKIFIHSFLLGAVVLLLCTALFFGLQYREKLDETYDALKGETVYAAGGAAIGGDGYLDSIKGINRITRIAADGSVLYDSDHPDNVRNQKEYPEVRDAFAEGEGRDIRHSESGGRNTIYYALLCEDGTVLRLSRPLGLIQAAFHSVRSLCQVWLLPLW